MDSTQNDGIDALQRSLKQVLGRIQTDLGMILPHSDLDDPDGFLLQFDDRMHRLDEQLERLSSLLGRMSRALPTDFNLLAERALQDALSLLGVPVVVQSTWGRALPPLDECMSDPVAAVLRRLFSLAVREARAGGEVRIETKAHDGRLLLHVDVCCAEPGLAEAAQEPRHLRCRSVEEFVHDLGGRFHLADGPDGALHIVTQIPAGAAAHGELR